MSIWGTTPVRDTFFNVKTQYGAKANSSYDDGPAIQAALTDAGKVGGTVYLPATGLFGFTGGNYTVYDRTFVIPTGVQILGDNMFYTAIIDAGSGNVTMFTFTPSALGSGISNLWIQSRGHCINIDQTANVELHHLRLAALNPYWCVYSTVAVGNCFSPRLSNMYASGAGNGLLLCGDNVQVVGYDCAALGVGLRNCRGNHTIIGGRYEVNDRAIQVGVDENGNTLAATTCTYKDIQFESNYVGVEIHSASNCHFGPMGISGFAGHSNRPVFHGDPLHAMDVQLALDCAFNDVNASCDCTNSSVFKLGQVEGCTFDHCIPNNGGSTGDPRAFWTGIPPLSGGSTTGVAISATNVFRHCGLQSLPSLFGPNDTLLHDDVSGPIRIVSLQGLDYTNTAKRGKNLRAISQAVGNGATSVAINFQPRQGWTDISLTFGADTNAGGTLLGTYFYRVSGVTAVGEQISSTEYTHTYTAPNQTGNITIGANNAPLFGASTAQPCFFRVWRGTVTQVYDGYYETSVGTASTRSLTDTNAAFTVKGASPPNSIYNNDQQEADANYIVFASPSWTTAWSASSQATTGFTINFGTAAPMNATVSWFIVR